ncbi:MAG: glycosyltransferase family 4 protein [Thermoplasmata archaeon]|nr:glycosyltransferase family 4 protein [Thermoplasmata archaeon]
MSQEADSIGRPEDGYHLSVLVYAGKESEGGGNVHIWGFLRALTSMNLSPPPAIYLPGDIKPPDWPGRWVSVRSPGGRIGRILLSWRMVSRAIRDARSHGGETVFYTRSLYTMLFLVLRRPGGKKVLEVNGSWSREKGGGMREKMTSLLERFVLRRVDGLVCMGEALRGWVLSLGIPRERTIVVYNGTDTGLFRPLPREAVAPLEAELGLEGRKPVVFVGTFRRWHSAESILRAFSLVVRKDREAVLVLVGGGPETQRLGDAARRLGIEENVVFVGRVPHTEVPGYINFARVCVVPFSPDMLCGSPLKTFEYLACGKRIVAADVPGLREIFASSPHALLYRPEDPEDMAGKILTALETRDTPEDVEARIRLVEENFTWEKAVRDTLSFISRLVGEREVAEEAEPTTPGGGEG